MKTLRHTAIPKPKARKKPERWKTAPAPENPFKGLPPIETCEWCQGGNDHPLTNGVCPADTAERDFGRMPVAELSAIAVALDWHLAEAADDFAWRPPEVLGRSEGDYFAASVADARHPMGTLLGPLSLAYCVNAQRAGVALLSRLGVVFGYSPPPMVDLSRGWPPHEREAAAR